MILTHWNADAGGLLPSVSRASRSRNPSLGAGIRDKGMQPNRVGLPRLGRPLLHRPTTCRWLGHGASGQPAALDRRPNYSAELDRPCLSGSCGEVANVRESKPLHNGDVACHSTALPSHVSPRLRPTYTRYDTGYPKLKDAFVRQRSVAVCHTKHRAVEHAVGHWRTRLPQPALQSDFF